MKDIKKRSQIKLLKMKTTNEKYTGWGQWQNVALECIAKETIQKDHFMYQMLHISTYIFNMYIIIT